MDDMFRDYNPLTDVPKTLAHARVASLALERLEDRRGEWREHWKSLGVNRQQRRQMLKALLARLGPKNVAWIRSIAATARQVRAASRLAASVAAAEKVAMGVAR